MTSIAAIGSTQHGVCVPGWSLDGNTAGLWARCNDGTTVAGLFAGLKPALTPPHAEERVAAAELLPPPSGVAPPVAHQVRGESRQGGIAMFSVNGAPLTETGASHPGGEGIQTGNASPSGFSDGDSVPPLGESGPLLQCAGCLTRPTNPTGPSGPGTPGGPVEPGRPVSPSEPIVPSQPIDTLPTSVVPEPSAWTLLIFGFGFAGAITRRRTPRPV